MAPPSPRTYAKFLSIKPWKTLFLEFCFQIEKKYIYFHPEKLTGICSPEISLLSRGEWVKQLVGWMAFFWIVGSNQHVLLNFHSSVVLTISGKLVLYRSCWCQTLVVQRVSATMILNIWGRQDLPFQEKIFILPVAFCVDEWYNAEFRFLKNFIFF